jgi:hypothetical protein
MRRPIILGGNPYISDIYRKSAKALFDESGGNSGNLAFQFAIANHLASQVTIQPWGAPAEQIRAAGDVIILPLANQLGKHTDLGHTADRLLDLNLPIIGVGLGAQSDIGFSDIELSPGTMSWLATLARLKPGNGPNIGARGPFTKGQIDRLGFTGSAIVTGCPSHFINDTDITARLAQGYARAPRFVAVTAGIPWAPKLKNIEQDLANIVTLCGSAYIVQHGLEMLRLARGEFDDMEPATLETCRNYIAPHLGTEEFKTWCTRYAIAFYDARAWMDYMRRFDFVVGTRFHGTMLAIQAGVPAGCFTHDSRTQEMCETMGVPHCPYDQVGSAVTLRNVREYFKFDKDKFRESRGRLLENYLSLYRAADIAIPRRLEILASRPSPSP